MKVARVSLAAVLVASCYQSTTAPDAGPPVDQARAFVAARAAELCRRAIGCERRSFDPLWSEVWCHPRLAPLSSQRVENVASGAQRFDPVRAEECLRILRAGSGCLESYAYMYACWEPFTGTLPSGAPCDPTDSYCGVDLRCDPERCLCEPARPIGAMCRVSEDCGRGARCSSAEVCVSRGPVERGTPCVRHSDCPSGATTYEDQLFCIEGRCERLETLQAGDACVDGYECGPDLGCRVDGTCDRLAGLGEDCSSNACRDELNCVDGVCTVRPGEGEACGVTVRCAAEAPYCVASSATGDYRCRRSATGLECVSVPTAGLVDPLSAQCPPATHACVPDRGAFDARGTCQPIVGIGAGCDLPVVCPTQARCVDGICVRIVMPDEPCGPQAVCPVTHACDDGACVPLPVRGERCHPEHACLTGACIDGFCGQREPGDICSEQVECEFGCEDGRCAAGAREGEACGRCEHGLRCATWLSEPVCVADMCTAD